MSGEGREEVRDAAPPALFPGMFGEPNAADPFQAYKQRIDAEEPEPEAGEAKLPEKMPEKCPSCAESLDPSEPVAFCYHCGAALS
jgi:hypothetical protein